METRARDRAGHARRGREPSERWPSERARRKRKGRHGRARWGVGRGTREVARRWPARSHRHVSTMTSCDDVIYSHFRWDFPILGVFLRWRLAPWARRGRERPFGTPAISGRDRVAFFPDRPHSSRGQQPGKDRVRGSGRVRAGGRDRMRCGGRGRDSHRSWERRAPGSQPKRARPLTPKRNTKIAEAAPRLAGEIRRAWPAPQSLTVRRAGRERTHAPFVWTAQHPPAGNREPDRVRPVRVLERPRCEG